MLKLNFKEYARADELAEITNPTIYTSNKHTTFSKDSLYSEQIFGPVKPFRCQCGKLFGKINNNEVCEVCGVLCGKTDSRSTQFAKIVLPANIYIVNPDFKNALQAVFGHSSIKNILSSFQYNQNKEFPYYFNFTKNKLLKSNKISEAEMVKCIPIPVFDITSLKELFDFMVNELSNDCFDTDIETGEIVRNNEPDKFLYREIIFIGIKDEFLDYVFLNYVLVIPPSSRQVIKISSTKILPHPISKAYIEILKNISKGTSVLDNLYNANSDFFGHTVYKYQQSVDAIYDEILQFNFQKKENYVRESLTGKTIEFSQRAVIVPNPVLKPFQIGLPEESVKKIFLPELLRFLFLKYENEEIEVIEETGTTKYYDIVDYIQYIYNSFDSDFNLTLKDDVFKEFLKTNISEFRTLVERQPNLWKYSSSGYTVARVYGDSHYDTLNLPELNDIPEEYRDFYFDAMQEAPDYIKQLKVDNSSMYKVMERNMKLAVKKIYLDKVKSVETEKEEV